MLHGLWSWNIRQIHIEELLKHPDLRHAVGMEVQKPHVELNLEMW